LFFVKPEVKSQWTVLVGYITISTDVSHYQTYYQLENIGGRIDMQTHIGSSSTRLQQHTSLATASLATVRP